MDDPTVLRQILLNLPVTDIENLCRTDKKLEQVCRSPDFNNEFYERYKFTFLEWLDLKKSKFYFLEYEPGVKIPYIGKLQKISPIYLRKLNKFGQPKEVFSEIYYLLFTDGTLALLDMASMKHSIKYPKSNKPKFHLLLSDCRQIGNNYALIWKNNEYIVYYFDYLDYLNNQDDIRNYNVFSRKDFPEQIQLICATNQQPISYLIFNTQSLFVGLSGTIYDENGFVLFRNFPKVKQLQFLNPLSYNELFRGIIGLTHDNRVVCSYFDSDNYFVWLTSDTPIRSFQTVMEYIQSFYINEDDDNFTTQIHLRIGILFESGHFELWGRSMFPEERLHPLIRYSFHSPLVQTTVLEPLTFANPIVSLVPVASNYLFNSQKIESIGLIDSRGRLYSVESVEKLVNNQDQAQIYQVFPKYNIQKIYASNYVGQNKFTFFGQRLSTELLSQRSEPRRSEEEWSNLQILEQDFWGNSLIQTPKIKIWVYLYKDFILPPTLDRNDKQLIRDPKSTEKIDEYIQSVSLFEENGQIVQEISKTQIWKIFEMMAAWSVYPERLIAETIKIYQLFDPNLSQKELEQVQTSTWFPK